MTILMYVIGLLGLGGLVLGIKNWWSKRKVNQLTDEERAIFKKIDAIPDEVKKQSEEQNVDFWNKKDPNA